MINVLGYLRGGYGSIMVGVDGVWGVLEQGWPSELRSHHVHVAYYSLVHEWQEDRTTSRPTTSSPTPTSKGDPLFSFFPPTKEPITDLPLSSRPELISLSLSPGRPRQRGFVPESGVSPWESVGGSAHNRGLRHALAPFSHHAQGFLSFLILFVLFRFFPRSITSWMLEALSAVGGAYN